MPFAIDTKYVKIIIIIFILLTFIQITEEIFKTNFVETASNKQNGGLIDDIIGGISQIPVIGFLFNFFTITIPDAPFIILIFLNLINTIIWVYFAISINNLVVTYLNLDEGLLGWLI